jgi:hypothetical protein
MDAMKLRRVALGLVLKGAKDQKNDRECRTI